MSSHKLNKIVGEYNKSRSPASAVEKTEKPQSKKAGKKLEFKDSEGYEMREYDMRKKGKKSEE